MEDLNIYEVTNYSNCGSYFATYLQSVLVVAKNEKEALHIAKLKCDFEKHNNFKVNLIKELSNIKEGDVLLNNYNSDY